MLEKCGALVFGLAVIALVLVASLWLGGLLVDMDIGVGVGVGHLLAAGADQLMLGAAFGAVALLIACLTGKRGLARGMAAGSALAAFLLHSLAPLAPH